MNRHSDIRIDGDGERPEEKIRTGWPQVGAKKALYARLADLFSLPPRDSKGVTLKYLERVEEGTVFRVEIIELNKFLAGLRPSQLRKAGFTCKYVALKKMDRLLAELGKPGLGFEPGIIPDGTWLYKIARFIDPANVCGIFEVALEEIPRTQVDSFKVELAKRAAEDYLITSSGLNKATGVKAALEELTLLHRRQGSRQAELDSLIEHGRRLEVEVRESERLLQARLVSATVLVQAAGEKKSPEEAMEENEGKRKEIHGL
jgi:hypothetical protein